MLIAKGEPILSREFVRNFLRNKDSYLSVISAWVLRILKIGIGLKGFSFRTNNFNESSRITYSLNFLVFKQIY
jgi:hypothetical protein